MLGAGPAGLTAAHVLALRGQRGTVFEADGIVGGLAKTVECNGYRFDLGGHRFFTKLAPIQRLWETTLGEEFLVRPRLSRIYYDGKYLAYPLQATDVVARLGIVESALCAASYLWNRARRSRDPKTFEDWVTTRFGKRLYDTFFRSYTEKVWGISGSEIEAAWAAQRIKDFSLAKAILKMVGFRRGRDDPDRGVSLSATRPWTDVGSLRGPRRAGGHPGSAEQPVHRDPPSGQPCALRRDRRVGRNGARARRRRAFSRASLCETSSWPWIRHRRRP